MNDLIAGNCNAGRQLTTGTFVVGNGELCGATQVTSYSISRQPVTPSAATDVTFATNLITTGTTDGSIRPGTLTWFYSLKLQADGSWRITGGGSGP